MTYWTPEFKQQIDSICHDYAMALCSAFILKHRQLCKLITTDVKPTEFVSETRYWVEAATDTDIAANPELQKRKLERFQDSNLVKKDAERYCSLTTLPPEKAMLSVTFDGRAFEMVFVPKIQSAKPPKKGFGKSTA